MQQTCTGCFLEEAAYTAVYCLSRTSSRMLIGKTPFEVWHGSRPSVGHTKVFGADAFVHNLEELWHKLEPKSIRGIFKGYILVNKAYWIWLNVKQCITESPGILFDDSSVIKRLFGEAMENTQVGSSNLKYQSLPTNMKSPSTHHTNRERGGSYTKSRIIGRCIRRWNTTGYTMRWSCGRYTKHRRSWSYIDQYRGGRRVTTCSTWLVTKTKELK